MTDEVAQMLNTSCFCVYYGDFLIVQLRCNCEKGADSAPSAEEDSGSEAQMIGFFHQGNMDDQKQSNLYSNIDLMSVSLRIVTKKSAV